jgi:hypothetical protein
VPISIASIKANSKTVGVELDGADEPLVVVYNPANFTPARQASLSGSDGEDAEAQTERFIDAFCTIVDRFGNLEGPLFDEDDPDEAGNPREVVPAGQPVPVEPEYVRLLPFTVINKVLEAIQEDMTADPKERQKPSRSGSFARGRARSR